MRGTAEFEVMKGFESGFVTKANDGHESDTMPPDPGADVTDKAESELDEAGETKPAANIKPGDNKPGSASTTMADDVAEVEDAAEKPIDDGYVQDAQGEKVSDGGDVEKGWEAYNEKCASGLVVKDFGLKRGNADEALKAMQSAVDAEFDTVVKCGKKKIVGKAGDDESEEKKSEEEKDESFSEEGPEEEKGAGSFVRRLGSRMRARSPLGSEMDVRGKRVQQMGQTMSDKWKSGKKKAREIRGRIPEGTGRAALGGGLIGGGAGLAAAGGMGLYAANKRRKKKK